MAELKPCPFCGNHPDLDFHASGCKRYFDDMGVPRDTPILYTVKCPWCGCAIGAYESTDGAIESWNRRTDKTDV